MSWILWSVLFGAFYLLGTVAPEQFWGTHAFRFLPPPWTVGILAVATLAWLVGGRLGIVLDSTHGADDSGQKRDPESPPRHLGVTVCSLLIALGFGFLCYASPIATDIYGDARNILLRDIGLTQAFDSRWLEDLFSPEIFVSNNGPSFNYNLVRILSHGLEVSPADGYRILNAVSGFAFALIWIRFVLRNLSRSSNRLLGLLIGLTAGPTLLFHEHYEIYPTALVVLLLFLVSLVELVRRPGPGRWIFQVFLLLLAIKSHSTGFLLVGPLLLAIPVSLENGGRVPLLTRTLGTWRSITFFGLIPGLVLVGLFYVFATGDHAISHIVDSSRQRVDFFLPTIAVDHPFPRNYTLFSPAHLVDFLSISLLWSAASLFLITGAWLFDRKQVSWNLREIRLLGCTTLFYVGFFFLANPILSMPRDWDLFSIPAVPLLVFAILILQQLELRGRIGSNGRAYRAHSPVFAGTAALSILAVGWIPLNTNERALSARLVSIGSHVFKTYYAGSAYLITVGIAMTDDPLVRRERVIDRLEPWATPGNDSQYADLLVRQAFDYYETGEMAPAAASYERAIAYKPEDDDLRETAAVALLRAGRPDVALVHARRLADSSPESESRVRLALESAIESGRFGEGLIYGERLLELTPENRSLEAIVDELRRRAGQ